MGQQLLLTSPVRKLIWLAGRSGGCAAVHPPAATKATSLGCGAAEGRRVSAAFQNPESSLPCQGSSHNMAWRLPPTFLPPSSCFSLLSTHHPDVSFPPPGPQAEQAKRKAVIDGCCWQHRSESIPTTQRGKRRFSLLINAVYS